MAKKGDCIFCKIAAKKLPSSVVYEDSKVLAFLDINPANKGHTLIIPKNHYDTIEKVPDSFLGEIIKIVKAVGKAVIKAVEADGFNILQNNGKAAGQLVGHVHFQVIPRFEDDVLEIGIFSGKPYEEGEAKEVAKEMRKAMMD